MAKERDILQKQREALETEEEELSAQVAILHDCTCISKLSGECSF